MAVDQIHLNEQDLDSEWVDLIREALELGIPASKIRDFLNK
ncbi:anti-repressor SinI family protein [Mesobacillus foraminis]|uniref:Anti-repressor SinI n=1 Tax=Mesobacillus foraminis TaxID=279826 RepID=A0A4R2AZ05_9BACI|nr:anti-repressor SinI family protein [Mesobacillus foraminis]TCN18434.1 anti-repressor SinI [Mesobacillus foraminis]